MRELVLHKPSLFYVAILKHFITEHIDLKCCCIMMLRNIQRQTPHTTKTHFYVTDISSHTSNGIHQIDILYSQIPKHKNLLTV
jgi:hypothetical protein